MQDLEDAVCPARTARLTAKLSLSLLVLVLGFVVVKTAVYYMWRAEDVTTTITRDKLWFTRTEAELRALDTEIEAASMALERARVEMAARWVSRADDRQHYNQLNQNLVQLLTQRAELIKEYTIALETTTCGSIAPERSQ